jgi:hypothetical protein
MKHVSIRKISQGEFSSLFSILVIGYLMFSELFFSMARTYFSSQEKIQWRLYHISLYKRMEIPYWIFGPVTSRQSILGSQSSP